MLETFKSYWTMEIYDFAFTDIVSGKEVYYWTDCFNNYFLATDDLFGKFFRMKITRKMLDHFKNLDNTQDKEA